MFNGDVNMWRSIVSGRIARKATNNATWPIHHHWCHVSSVDADHPSTSPLSG